MQKKRKMNKNLSNIKKDKRKNETEKRKAET